MQNKEINNKKISFWQGIKKWEDDRKNRKKLIKLIKKYNPKESKLLSIACLSGFVILGITGFILGRHIDNLPHTYESKLKIVWLLGTWTIVIIVFCFSLFLWLLRLKAKSLLIMKKENEEFKKSIRDIIESHEK